MKKSRIIFFLIFLLYPFFSYSHVNHYDKFKIIKMDVFRNGEVILLMTMDEMTESMKKAGSLLGTYKPANSS